MESLVFQNSPLAEILQGTALEGETPPQNVPDSDDSDSEPVSFAPRGPPAGKSAFRQKFAEIQKEQGHIQIDQLSRLYRRCRQFVLTRLASKNAKFLERFRYLLVTSQLLNDHATAQGYNPRLSLQNVAASVAVGMEWEKPALTPQGTALTASAAFLFAWSIHWTRVLLRGRTAWYRLCLLVVSFGMLAGITYALYGWQRRVITQRKAIEEASWLVSKAQELDVSTASAISLVQEVELVSRGYRISSPLPPVSRMEDQNQSKRCERLRRTLRKSIDNTLLPYAQAYKRFREHAVDLDLERYNDIYEVSRMDIEEVEALAHGGSEDFYDPETLKSLKTSLQRLHTSRKLFLCTLLTIPFFNQTASVSLWSDIARNMHHLAQASSTASSDLDSILSEQMKFSQPTTPLKSPLTPGRERLQAQTRKFGFLAQGTRELQAKLFLLREDCDRALAGPIDETEAAGASNKLLEQYDAFGVDLRSLLQEWEDGRTALASALDRHNDRRVSLASSVGLTEGRSATPSSLSAVTSAGEGSPAEALRILNGEALSPLDAHSSDDEVFEAIAMPRQRSSLTRDERIKKMHEERRLHTERRERADESRRMVKELESVIKLRPLPAGAKKGRVTSV